MFQSFFLWVAQRLDYTIYTTHSQSGKHARTQCIHFRQEGQRLHSPWENEDMIPYSKATCTVEPLNNGHIGMHHFVHYREVVLFQRQRCIATIQIGALESVLYTEVSFIQSVLYQRFHCTCTSFMSRLRVNLGPKDVSL